MEPEVQKLAVTALVGLLFLFPVFNQVQASSLEALRDADHKAKFKDFIKDWDDIPEDEKLAYWDGRNKPPGDGDFDRDDVDDDARIHQPDQGEPTEGDRDGDGVPDEEDVDPDDPEVTEQRRKVHETVVLWRFEGDDRGDRDTVPLPPPEAAGDTYDNVTITWGYSGFTGQANFRLLSDGANVWEEDIQTGAGVYSVAAEDDGTENAENVPTERLEVVYDYTPLADPNDFLIEITGTYSYYQTVTDESE